MSELAEDLTEPGIWHSTAVKPETLCKMRGGKRNLIVVWQNGLSACSVLYEAELGTVHNHSEGLAPTPLTDFDFWCRPPRKEE